MANLSALNEKFSIPGHVTFKAGPQDLIIIEVDSVQASAQILLQGAQVIRWTPKGHKPVIWLSDEARYIAGKSVRGGIPICWPWFGPHPSESEFPAHGYARNLDWELIDTGLTDEQEIRLVFRLPESEQAQRYWPQAVDLQYVVTVGARLKLDLQSQNLSDATITLSEALHSYFEVGDISQVSVHGLEDTEYLDKVANGERKLQQGPVSIGEEVDRVYLDTRSDCIIRDPVLNRHIRIEKLGSETTVVWNPWLQKSRKLGDMGDEGYRRMLCVESANAAEKIVSIAPGDSHQLSVIYHVESQA